MVNLTEGEKLLNEPNNQNYQNLIEKIIFLEKREYENIIKLILEDKNTPEDSLVRKLHKNFGL